MLFAYFYSNRHPHSHLLRGFGLRAIFVNTAPKHEAFKTFTEPNPNPFFRTKCEADSLVPIVKETVLIDKPERVISWHFYVHEWVEYLITHLINMRKSHVSMFL